jgi:plasmid replication initiation protein
MTNLMAYKSNDLVEASYKLTLQEQRFVFACIVRLRAFHVPAEEQKTLVITASEFYERFPDMGRDNAERELKKAVDLLWERTIVIKGDKSKREVRWLQERAEYFSGEGRVEITFSDSVLPYLTMLNKQLFTRVTMKDISRLTSVYSIRIYELLQRFRATGDRTIRLDDFR